MIRYLSVHWRGEHSLTKSALLNGVLAYILLVAVLVSAGKILSSKFFVYAGMAFILTWFFWALVGMSRCAIKAVTSESPILQKFGAVAILFSVVAAVVFSARDFWFLLIEPMVQ